MTISSPPYVLQGGSHGAQLFREAISSLINYPGGIVEAGDLTVAQQTVPNMSVQVAAGRIWIPGTTLAAPNVWYPQGLYFAENDASVTLSISAADPSKPRIDTIIGQVQDAAYAGASNLAQLAVVTGTPTAGATLVNLNGAASVPASSLVIAYVLVPAIATSIITADISNVAALATSGLGGDTGWVALTLGTNIIAGGSYTPSARLQGGTIRLKGQLQNNTGGSVAVGTTVATIPAIPAGLRPGETMATPAPNGLASVNILASGAMQVAATVANWPLAGVIYLDSFTFTAS